MVIGLLAVASIPTVIGVGQAVSAQKKQNAAAGEKVQFHLTSTFRVDGAPAGEDDPEAYCVLVDGKIHVDHAACPVKGHRFNGYYFKYPSEEGHRGLVSTIADDPPMLNWIFVDADTRAVRYAGRKDSVGHVIGPWGWTEDERLLTLRGSEGGFVVVREEGAETGTGTGAGTEVGTGTETEAKTVAETGTEPREDGNEGQKNERWAVYWDPDGELIRRKGPEGCVGVTLRRRLRLGMESRYIKGDK